MRMWAWLVTVVVLIGMVWFSANFISQLRPEAEAKGYYVATVMTSEGETYVYPALPPLSAPQPEAVVPESIYDFGMMDIFAEHEHAFVIRNEGEGPLELRKGETTCACTISNLVGGVIPPGGEANVVLGWKTKGGVEDYRETAEILTNDRDNRTIKLVIKGKVRNHLFVLPKSINLPAIPSSQPTALTVHVLSPAYLDFKITDIESSSPYLTHKLRPAPPSVLAKAQEVSTYEMDRGYEVEVTVQPEPPGRSRLPLGRFRERLTIHTSIPERPRYDLDVMGLVVGDITLFGSDWDSDLWVLDFGNVPRSLGKRRALSMYVRGAEADIQPRATSTAPEFLRVTVERLEKSGTSSSRPLAYRVEIEVPPGAPLGNYLGVRRGEDEPVQIGEIHISTDHPREKELRLLVKFAVEDR